MSPSSVLRVHDLFQNKSIVGEWEELHRSRQSSFFLSPLWSQAWWEWMDRPSGRVALWYTPDGSLAAVVPLVETKERVHPKVPVSIPVLTNLGSGAGSADHHGWLSKDEMLASTWKWVAEQAEGISVLLRSLDPRIAELAPNDAIILAESPCPRLDISEGLEVVGSKSFTKKIHYYERRLDGEGVTFHWTPPDKLKAEDVDVLFELHGDRHSLKDEDSFFKRTQVELHKRLAEAQGVKAIGPAAMVARYGSEPVGILYGFRSEEAFAYFQSGWSPDWAAFNLGTALITKTIQRMHESGVTVFDFLRGPESYKYRFGAVDRIDSSFLLPGGKSGKMLVAKYRVKELRSS